MGNDVGTLGRIGAFVSPSQIVFGVGAVNRAGGIARSLGGKKVLIVTDPGVAKAGLTKGIEAAIAAKNLEVAVFDGVEPEPPSRVIDECSALIRKEGFNLIIGLGGGSSMDTAKMASIMATNEGAILDYVGKMVPNRGLPKILLPTTAGSGAEVSPATGVRDESKMTKVALFGNHYLADAVILDPSLTVSLPPQVTAETGIDALTQAIEPYLSASANQFSDMLAIEAIGLISKSLPAAFARGEDIEARSKMQFAATLAGLAMGSGSLGAVHSLAFVLETEFKWSHAKTISIMLPHVMDFNKTKYAAKYARIATAMGENIDGLSMLEAAEKSVAAVKKLLDSLNIKASLTANQVSREKLPVLVEKAKPLVNMFPTNPSNLGEDDIRSIYSKAFE